MIVAGPKHAEYKQMYNISTMNWSRMSNVAMFWAILSEVTLMASKIPDVPFNQSITNVTFVEQPGILRLALQKIIRDASRTFQTARLNYEKIAQLNEHLPDHLMQATLYLTKMNADQIAKFLPIPLNRIMEVCDQTKLLTRQLLSQFKIVGGFFREVDLNLFEAYVKEKRGDSLTVSKLREMAVVWNDLYVKWEEISRLFQDLESLAHRNSHQSVLVHGYIGMYSKNLSLPFPRLFDVTKSAEQISFLTRGICNAFAQVSGDYIFGSHYEWMTMQVEDVEAERQHLWNNCRLDSQKIVDYIHGQQLMWLQTLADSEVKLKEKYSFLLDAAR